MATKATLKLTLMAYTLKKPAKAMKVTMYRMGIKPFHEGSMKRENEEKETFKCKSYSYSYSTLQDIQ